MMHGPQNVKCLGGGMPTVESMSTLGPTIQIWRTKLPLGWAMIYHSFTQEGTLKLRQHIPLLSNNMYWAKLSKQCIKYLKPKFYLCHTVFLLTPRCRDLLEQLTGLQLVKKFPVFHGTRRFITALTSVRHLSLSWASPIQSIYPQPNSWRSILILSTHLRLGLPSGLFPSGFPTKTLYTPFSSPIRATCPAHLAT